MGSREHRGLGTGIREWRAGVGKRRQELNDWAQGKPGKSKGSELRNTRSTGVMGKGFGNGTDVSIGVQQ